MRISDWSSDVCSSDLDVVLVVAEAALAARGKHADHLACRVPDAKPLADRIGPAKQVLHDRVADDADGLARLFFGRGEIAAALDLPVLRHEIIVGRAVDARRPVDRKSTRLNSSH